tara:strand:+ start:8974 stop:10266 length:1293 start_codon:yes stop_codon:yes gene_type:complete
MLLVYTPKITSRISYVFKHIFIRMLKLEVGLTMSVADFVSHNGPKLSYSNKPLGNELFFYSTKLLIDQGIQDHTINISHTSKYPVFFQVNDNSAMSFDVFAATFYLISRYEEYLPHLKDFKGRFKFKESVAFKNNFLDKPLIDIWVVELKKILIKNFQITINDPIKNKKIFPILEVSEPYMFRHKSIISSFNQALNSIWNLNFKMLINQFYVIFRIRTDPFLEYDFIINQFKNIKIDITSFFRFTQHSYDIGAISIYSLPHKLLIKNISDKISLNLLVSFFAQKKIKVLKSEMYNLTKLIHRTTQKVRLNYGILSISEIYPMLVLNEVSDDFSMGYDDQLGYRASTSIPFYYYDLINEVQSPLKIHPIAVTEKALRKLPIKHAFEKLRRIHSELPLNNSIFYFVFTPYFFSKSKENLLWRSSLIKYIDEL